MVPTASSPLSEPALPSLRRLIGRPLDGAAMQRAAERHMRAAVNDQRARDVGGRTTSSDLRAAEIGHSGGLFNSCTPT